MRNRPFTLAYGGMLILRMTGPAVAQDNGIEQPSARQQLQHIHAPQSIDQELARLTKDLELTPEQQQQVRPLSLRSTTIGFRHCSIRIRKLRGTSLVRRFTLSATKRTARFMAWP